MPALPVGIADAGQAQAPPLRPVVVKLVDFGIAKLRESGVHTKTGMEMGTPAYMSFEQASGMRSDELDARSDIYSLGVVAYEMLTGHVPFQSDTSQGYARMHMNQQPPPFRDVAPGLGIPPAVERAVMKALLKDRNQRYASALNFASEASNAAQPPPPAESPMMPDHTLIVLTPAPEISQPCTTTIDLSPLKRKKPPVPIPPSANAQARPDNARQTSPLVPPVKNVASPGAQVEGSKTSPAASRSPAKPNLPQFLTTLDPSANEVKVVAIVGFALILVVAAVWRSSKRIAKDVNQGEIIKKGDVSWSAKPGESKGEVRVNPNDRLKYVWIPPGRFQMGCSPQDSECDGDEEPPHQVTITKSFWLGQTVVTVGAYKRFAAATGWQMPAAPDLSAAWNSHDMPVVNVTWNDATAFCGWAGSRLPTEAEWEYAARAGSTEARYGPLDEVAWYANNSGRKTHEVGKKRANGFGLYDVLGNVWEWVNDWYDQNYYQKSRSQDPSGPASGQFRVLRGGSWYSFPRYVRVSYRYGFDPTNWLDNFGFRCAGEVAGP